MRKNLSCAIVLILLANLVSALEPLDVTEQTIKLPGLTEEKLYFGFAEGDKIVITFQEINGKALKEVEIIEYPYTSKFSDYETNRIEGKTIPVLKQGVYVFRFYNSALAGRVCKISIQRIPAYESSKTFNTAVTWIERHDTTWNTYTKDVLVGYDTLLQTKVRKELVQTEQHEEIIMDKIQRVHSMTNENGNKTHVFFSLPQNQVAPYKTTKVISWAYWVGVDEAGNKAWEYNSQIIKEAIKGAARICFTPLGALAAGIVADLTMPSNTIGEDVYYGLADQQNKDLFLAGYQFKIWDQGKGLAGYKKFSDAGFCQGTYFIVLENDNVMQGINACVKVSAIVETQVYEDKQYIEPLVTPRYEKRVFKDPVVSTTKVPVAG